MRVGLIAVGRIFDESKRGKALSGKLKAVMDKWQQQIDELQAKAQRARERDEQADAHATIESRFKSSRDARLYDLEVRSLQERQQFDVEAHRDFFRAQLLREVRPAFEAMAKEMGLALVLSVSGPEVAFAAEGVDLTDAMLQRLDGESPR